MLHSFLCKAGKFIPGYPRGVSVLWTKRDFALTLVHGTDTPRGYPGIRLRRNEATGLAIVFGKRFVLRKVGAIDTNCPDLTGSGNG